MAATALIVFDQGGPGTVGEAFEGTIAGGAVTVTNDSDTDVTAFEFTMLDVPPGSSVPTGSMASGAPPSTTSFTPDVPGSYRVQLAVTGASTSDTDIRCFGVRNARGIIIPPFQRNPDPLPLTGSGVPGAKPDEQNYSGQARGWAGDRSVGQLEEFFHTYDDLPFVTVTAAPFTIPNTNQAPLYVVDLSSTGSPAIFNFPLAGWRIGQRIRVLATGGAPLDYMTVTPPAGHTINGVASLVQTPGSCATYMYLGSNAWAALSAKADRYERTLVAGVETVGVVGFQAVGGTVSVTPENYPNGTTLWQATVSTTNAADAVEIQLFNLTLGSLVVGSLLTTTSIIPVVVSNTVTLAPGANVYEAQMRLQTTGAPNQATCLQAQIAINWLQP